MSTLHDLDVAAELPLVPGLGDVSPEALAEIAAVITQRRVAARGVATEQGVVPVGLAILVRGAVKAVRTTSSGQGEVSRVLGVTRASAVIADAAVFDGLPSDISVVALRATHWFVLERRALLRLMVAHPSFDRAMLARFVRASRSHAHRVDELACGSVEERVVRLLDGLAAQHGTPLGRGRFVAIPLRRHDLASMVNATTATVSRLLARLEREGKLRSSRDGLWWRGAGSGRRSFVSVAPGPPPHRL
jgi:CRP-like cAMP-binding protein